MMKVAAVVTDPPWCPRTRWYVHNLQKEFPDCTLLTVARGDRAKRRLKQLYRMHGPLKFLPHLAAAIVYRRYTDRIDRVARDYFEPMVGDLEAPSPSVRVRSLKDPAFLDWLDRERPDVIVPVAGGIIGPELLAKCKWVRWHHGITPDIRGLASPFWAIHDQRPDWLGITIQELVRKLDVGPILAQERLTVQPDDDLATIHLKLDLVVCKNLLQALQELRDGVSRALPCQPNVGTYRSSPSLRSLMVFPSRQRRFIRTFAD